jgi:hypothetical protein
MSQGTKVKVQRPGTLAANAQCAHDRSTPAIWWANLAMSGLATMPVRNIAEAA